MQDLILIIDDEASDQNVLTHCLRKLGVQNPILCLEEGRDAIRYFQGDTFMMTARNSLCPPFSFWT